MHLVQRTEVVLPLLCYKILEFPFTFVG